MQSAAGCICCLRIKSCRRIPVVLGLDLMSKDVLQLLLHDIFEVERL